MPDVTIKIYALIAPPLYMEPRYIGVTKRRLDQRLRVHVRLAQTGIETTHKARWILKALDERCEIIAILIDEVPISEWAIWERHYIANYANLTNGNAGGYGCLNPTDETRQRFRDRMTSERRIALADLRTGTKHSDEVKAKMSASHKGLVRSLEHSNNLSKALKGKSKTPEAREKMSKAHFGKRFTKEHCRKIAQAGIGRTVSVETRAKKSAITTAYYAQRRIYV